MRRIENLDSSTRGERKFRPKIHATRHKTVGGSISIQPLQMWSVQSGDDALRGGELEIRTKHPILYRISTLRAAAVTPESARTYRYGFRCELRNTKVNDIKQEMARKYELTYHAILKKIVTGPVVHADETKGVVYGGGHYVWIFANLNSVAYVYSASREASTLTEVLSGFKGVLVSDFYTAYDSLSCPQQKCLVHLMRDINGDLLKHPFNEELTFVAQQFGTLLRRIVETIDRHGLKKFFLQKHKRLAQQFIDEIASLDCSTEVGSALKKRIDKNKDKLFTFLDYDGVPWNNNNAEHAVRAFTRLRNGMSTSTPKGTTDYCILLSLQQTLKYRGIEFLDFLRSGRTDI